MTYLESDKIESPYPFIHIKVKSSLDLTVSSELLKEVKKQQQEGAIHFFIDLSDIELVFSAGLGALATLSSDIKNKNGKLLIICDKKRIQNLFQITSMRKIVTIVKTYEEAISFLQQDIKTE